MFTAGVPVQTFSPNQIQGEVGNNPELEQLIPKITDANLKDLLELVTTRSAMQIPNQYAALLLDDDLTPVVTDSDLWGNPSEWSPSCMQHVDKSFAGPAPQKTCFQHLSFHKW